MTGTVTLSIELELAWGLARLAVDPTTRHDPTRRQETETLDRLLTATSELEVPISFDVVGHLLLESCDGRHDGPHPQGWFDDDPGTDRQRDPLYYAPDLVERIRASDVEHELCTHTFSHARCDAVSEAVIDWELDRVATLHATRGLDGPRSFVPPVHAPPPYGVLADHGIRTVRRPDEYREPVEPDSPPDGALNRFVWRLQRSHPVETLARTPVVRSPTRTDGIVETYTDWHASLSAPYLPSGRQQPHAGYRLLPRQARQRLHRRYLLDGLRTVATTGDAVHYWTHLYNLSHDAQWPPLRSFFETLASYRTNQDIEVVTMAELGARVT